MSTQPPPQASGLVQAIRTLQLAFRLFASRRVPGWVKLVPIAALAYLIFPLDFVPDMLPGLGQVDDLTALLIGLWAFIQLCPQDVVRELRGDPDVVDGSYRVVKNDADKASSSAEQIPPAERR